MLRGEEWDEHYLLITHGNSQMLLDGASQEEFFEWHRTAHGGMLKIYSIVDLTEEAFEIALPSFAARGQVLYGEGS